MDLNKLAIECFKGKSLWRTLCNIKISELNIYGDLLDAGSKNLSASYYRYLDTSKVKKTTFVDYYSEECDDIVKIDLEKVIPLASYSYDTILLMNVLEHIYNHKLLLKELFRITRSGGVLIGSVPFMFRFHADPSDYYRFTHKSLERNLLDSGFQEVEVYTIGDGILILIIEQISRLIPSMKIFYILKLFLWLFAISFSELPFFNKDNIKVNKKQASYLGLVFKARKK